MILSLVATGSINTAGHTEFSYKRINSAHRWGQELILSDITLPNSHFLVDSSHMDKLISHQPIGAVLLISLVQGVTVQVPQHHILLSSVLADFSDIFAELKQLPPRGTVIIPFHWYGLQTVNIRSYQLPHHKRMPLKSLSNNSWNPKWSNPLSVLSPPRNIG